LKPECVDKIIMDLASNHLFRPKYFTIILWYVVGPRGKRTGNICSLKKMPRSNRNFGRSLHRSKYIGHSNK
jgi:hypothetical protein